MHVISKMGVNKHYLAQNKVTYIEHDLYIKVTWTFGYLSTDDQLNGNDTLKVSLVGTFKTN